VRLLQWRRGEAGRGGVDGETESVSTLPERLEVLGQLEWDGFLQAPVLEVVAERPARAAERAQAEVATAVGEATT